MDERTLLRKIRDTPPDEVLEITPAEAKGIMDAFFLHMPPNQALEIMHEFYRDGKCRLFGSRSSGEDRISNAVLEFAEYDLSFVRTGSGRRQERQRDKRRWRHSNAFFNAWNEEPSI